MEVLPCSGVRYSAESDCPVQGSRASLMFAGESNSLEHIEERQCAVPTSEVQGDGEAHYEVDLDDQKFSFDSHDSGNQKSKAQNQLIGSSAYTNGSGQPSVNQEPGAFISKSKWLETDEPSAIWVKWRGKWEAGIRCARADWPLSTLSAKPTHDRKKYLLIFFPLTRNYSWVDELLIKPITEFPEPIDYDTHTDGTKLVKDLTLARRSVMQKLALGTLSVLDQLHSEALVETSRNVMALKEFALEASRCKDYNDLGKKLLKLQNMIRESCINQQWLHHSQPSWVERCQSACSAEEVEVLKEELADSILWDVVNSLPDETALHEIISEWRKWFSMSNPFSVESELEQPDVISQLNMEVQVSRKRPKLEVRRAEMHVLPTEMVLSSEHNIPVETDSAYFNGDLVGTATLDSVPSQELLSLEGTVPPSSPSVVEKWGEIVVEAGNSDAIQVNNVELTPESGAIVVSSTDAVKKSRQCIAFIEHKGRQCIRWANEGDVYCCVHLASRFSSSSSKVESRASVDSPLCGGTTVLGTKCKHRSLNGSLFCKKHRPKDDEEVDPSLPENNLKRKHGDNSYRSGGVDCKEIILFGGVESSSQTPISSTDGDAVNRNGLVELFQQSRNPLPGTGHCIGLFQDGHESCLESPKKYSLYCDNHVPSWLKRARNGKSRIISKEVFIELLNECPSVEQKLNLHRACELFFRLFKSILSSRNPVPKDVQFQRALSEASKDILVGDFLLKLVCREKERIERLWGFCMNQNLQGSTSIEAPREVPMEVESDPDSETTIKCQLCSEKFIDDQALGTHWMEHHKREAQWLFRGYVCAICLDSFTNKKVLESHVQERHRVQFVHQCMLLQCIPCGSRFGNPEQLWSHVLAVHPNNLKQLSASEQQSLSKFVTPIQNAEAERSGMVGFGNTEHSSIRKFICRFCGLKFDLLPDLGRHHQAAHKGLDSAGAILPKRDGLHLFAQKLKSGRYSRPGFKKGIGSTSYRIRSKSAQNMRKHIPTPRLDTVTSLEIQTGGSNTGSLGRLADSQCSAVAQVLFSEIKRTKSRPTNIEILSIARMACCKVSLLDSLSAKYESLPERIYLRAAKLCSEQNILVNWHQEGFNCPRGCRKSMSVEELSLSIPLSDDVAFPKYSVPVDPVTSEWTMDECHYVIDSRHFNQDSSERIILCDDISFGKESVPIACVVDENLLGSLHIMADGSDGQITACSLPWESFTYITKPLLNQCLDLEVEGSQLGCVCAYSVCSPVSCDHVYLFDNDYEDAKDLYGKPMHGRFPYDERGRIILEEGYLVYECNQRCRCSKTCQNRVLQNGVRVKLEIFKTEKKGWAVRAREAILRGTFVCEYVGEVIDEQEAIDRRTRYGEDACGYFYEIDAQVNDISRLTEGQISFVIDATNHGNVSRYINHSCSPNLANHQVLVESMDCQLAHIGLFASRDIAMGEELTYDYRYKLQAGEGCPCLCGAPNCRGRLY